jgi:rhodanese-related sulfurtransferase
MIPAMTDALPTTADTPLVEVDRKALERLLFDPDVTVVDALPREAYRAGHIPGTYSLPVAEIPAHALLEMPDRARTIVVYCASITCHADQSAVRILRALGYTDVRAYPPGLAGWIEGGGAVESGPGHPIPGGVAATQAAQVPPVADTHVVAPASLRPLDAVRPPVAPPAFAARSAPARATVRSRAARPDRWSERFDAIVSLPARGLLALWLGIIIAFGILYWLPTLFGGVSLVAGGQPVGASLGGLWTSLYFSFVTGLSVGYGDVVPVGVMRIPAIAEGAADLLLFGFVVSKFMSRRQDQLLEELHHTAFEERLGRVRTNLHLVLSEFDAIGDDARDDKGAAHAARTLVRVESAALIFAGELRTIHELLYQPTEALEESALSGILASLAANLEALRDLLAELPAASLRSSVLLEHLRSTTTLAEEICGDCVPFAFTDDMRVWLDRVRVLARELPTGPPAAAPLAGAPDRA